MGRVSHGWWVRIAAGLLLLTAISATVSACAPQRGAALGANAAGAQRSLSALAPLTTTTPTTPVTTATTTATTTTTPSVTPSVTPVIPAAGSDPTAPPPVVSAAAAELYNATTGKTLYALLPDASLPMASTTKIMTAVVALTYGKLDQPITVGPDAVAIENGGTSVAGLRLGETLSLREMLYCLMLPSGDDAAIAIADSIGGSQSGFVALMNLEAGLLGLSHTHYANPHGLDAPEHFTSVSDLVRLADFAMNSPTFAQVVAAPSMTLPATATHHEYQLLNTNELLQNEPFAYDGAVGVKTGFTGPAGYCLVFMAKRPSGVLIGAILGEPTYNGRFTDAAALLTWEYNQLSPSPTPTATVAATATASPTP